MGIRTRRARAHSKTHFVGFGIAGVFGFIALLVVTLALSLGAVVSTWLEDLPDYTSADAFLVAEPTRVFDADGNEIVAYYLQNRRSVDLDQISDYVKKGTVDTEDSRFYSHNGIDIEGIMRAVVVQLTGGSEGGSTITQQLVRNTVLSDEQFENSLRRKVREAYIAIQMEKTYNKDQILNMYLNTIFYGNGAYGIEAAAITYFNKSAADLTLNEAATLIGIPNSPTAYDPFVNYESCKWRRNIVLERMLSAGTITQEEYDATVAEEIPLNPGELTDSSSDYPYFTDYVRELLLQDFSTETVQAGGLKVYTTLEPDKQKVAEEATLDRVEMSGDPELRSVLVCVDNSNGHVVAMVGNQYYGTDSDAGQSTVNIATYPNGRQAGSSFKTFVLIAAMLEGMSPTVQLDCRSPMQITSDWIPQNNANAQYGIRSLASATAISSNTAYAQVAECIGIDKVIDVAHLMGINSELKPVLATSLGGSEVTPLEMAEAYSTLANAGTHRDAIVITKIEDRNGNTVYEHEDNPEEVIDSAVAVDAIEVLKGVVQSGQTGWYVAAYFYGNQPVAGKTGTSDSADNLWFCGMTPPYTTVVWCGHEGNNRQANFQGSIATTQNTSQPIWCNFMNKILEGVPREEFPTSDHEATYEPNSTWDFVGTDPSINGGGNSGWSYNDYQPQQEQTPEPEVETTVETEPTTPATPTEPTEPETTTPTEPTEPSGSGGESTNPSTPTTPTEPTTPTTPTTPTEPTTPTTPDNG